MTNLFGWKLDVQPASHSDDLSGFWLDSVGRIWPSRNGLYKNTFNAPSFWDPEALKLCNRCTAIVSMQCLKPWEVGQTTDWLYRVLETHSAQSSESILSGSFGHSMATIAGYNLNCCFESMPRDFSTLFLCLFCSSAFLLLCFSALLLSSRFSTCFAPSMFLLVCLFAIYSPIWIDLVWDLTTFLLDLNAFCIPKKILNQHWINLKTTLNESQTSMCSHHHLQSSYLRPAYVFFNLHSPCSTCAGWRFQYTPCRLPYSTRSITCEKHCCHSAWGQRWPSPNPLPTWLDLTSKFAGL